jgi:putative tricarboxylic transport membrane protein
MAAIVAVLCSLGAYAANGNIADIYLAFGFGILGVVMKALGFSSAPFIMGLILGGDLLDVNFRRALLAGKGSFAPFFTRGVSIALILFIVLILLTQYLVPRLWGRRAKSRETILE